MDRQLLPMRFAMKYHNRLALLLSGSALAGFSLGMAVFYVVWHAR
jgi:hypothetical protein